VIDIIVLWLNVEDIIIFFSQSRISKNLIDLKRKFSCCVSLVSCRDNYFYFASKTIFIVLYFIVVFLIEYFPEAKYLGKTKKNIW
jgi:hypothetical protein